MRLINRFSGMAVEVPAGSKTAGARIAQYYDWGGANQQWQLVPAGTPLTERVTGSLKPAVRLTVTE